MLSISNRYDQIHIYIYPHLISLGNGLNCCRRGRWALALWGHTSIVWHWLLSSHSSCIADEKISNQKLKMKTCHVQLTGVDTSKGVETIYQVSRTAHTMSLKLTINLWHQWHWIENEFGTWPKLPDSGKYPFILHKMGVICSLLMMT